VSGLSAATAYQYRLLCYFEQSAPLFAGNQLTDGTLTTLAGATRSPSFAFSLATFSGATSYRTTLTAPDGVTQYTSTCTTSPCVVASVPVGDYTAVQQWLAGATVIASSDAQAASVR
jgi:hypothetical protein